jgi:hypothetical protein
VAESPTPAPAAPEPEQSTHETAQTPEASPKSAGRSAKTRFNAHMEHTANDETDKAISFINKNDLGWKADVCKLQKHHADYGSHCEAQEAATLA